MERATHFDLYRLFREEKHKSIEFHLTTFRHFVTLFIAIAGVTAGGVVQFRAQHGTVGVIVLVGSLMAALCSVLGVKTCDRFYRGVLSAVTVLRKLEVDLGLYVRTAAAGGDQADLPFRNDSGLLPGSWKNACAQYSTAEDFMVGFLNRGFNRYVHLTFWGMGALSLAGVVGGTMCLFL